jgi:hypothetical protein
VYGFRYYFTPLAGVLFTFRSRYYFAIGRPVVLSLAGWSPRIHTRFHVSGATWDTHRSSVAFDYETVTLYGWPSHAILLGTELVTSLGVLGCPVSPTTPTTQRPRPWHGIGLG